MNPATILIAILSGLFAELVENGIAQANPCRALSRTTRRLIKPTHDPRTTPFIEKLDDVRRVCLDLPCGFRTMPIADSGASRSPIPVQGDH